MHVNCKRISLLSVLQLSFMHQRYMLRLNTEIFRTVCIKRPHCHWKLYTDDCIRPL